MDAVVRVIQVRRVPAPLLFVIGGLSMYVGAAMAVWLFAEIPPASVAWLRQLGAALVLLAWRRPGRHAWRGRVFWLAAMYGLVTAGMNIVFYEAIARLPLGTAVALEFAGPVLVAAFGSRTRRDVAALLLVMCGVLLIADVQWSGSTSRSPVRPGSGLAVGRLHRARQARRGRGARRRRAGRGVRGGDGALRAARPGHRARLALARTSAYGRRGRRAGHGGPVRARPGRPAAPRAGVRSRSCCRYSP